MQDLRVDMFVDIHVDMRVDMQVDMRVDMRVDTREDKCWTRAAHHSKALGRGGVVLNTRHVCTHAIDMPSAMPI